MWIFRPAMPCEAAEACQVVRQSIEGLCGADHGDDPAVLERWLANKTPGDFAAWIEADPTGVIVGVGTGGVAGVGIVFPDGRIALNYVAPWARFRGVSKGLLLAMEGEAARLGNGCCTLTSTGTAHRFYQARGYEDVGAPVVSFGKLAFPMRRVIAGPGLCGTGAFADGGGLR